MLSRHVTRGYGKRSWIRRATAVVEMAVVSPLLLTLMFGIVEYGYRLMVHQTLVNAAREGARTAVLQGSTDDDIRGRIAGYLVPSGFANYTVTLTRGTTDNPVETVEVGMNKSDVSLFGCFFGTNTGKIVSSCSMRREGSV